MLYRCVSIVDGQPVAVVFHVAHLYCLSFWANAGSMHQLTQALCKVLPSHVRSSREYVMDKESMMLLCCRLDGCWQLLRKHLRTLHRCVCRGPVLHLAQRLPCTYADSSNTQSAPGGPQVSCCAPHQQQPLCLQAAALLCQ